MLGKEQKDKMIKKLLWGPGAKLEAFLAVTALVLFLVPMIRIALYAIPWYDDYLCSRFTKSFLEQEYTLKSLLKGIFYFIKTEWYAYQGTFSSSFFMALMPAVWGEEYYFLGPLFLICILTGAVFTFVMVLTRSVLKCDRAPAVTLAAGVTAMVVSMIYQAHQAFYWYNGGVHYVGMHSFLLLLIAAWVSLLNSTGRWKVILLMLWTLLGAVLAGGSNYVTSLQGMLIGLGMIVIGIVFRRKQVYRLLPSVLVYAVAFYMNVSAPGNNVRGAIYRDCGMSTDVVTAIVKSFTEAFRFMGLFTWQMTLAVMLLLAPVIWRIVKNSQLRFRYPGVILLCSFCLYATGFTSSLYVTGAVALARVVNAAKITYQLLVIINEVYWLGWVCRKLEKRAETVGTEKKTSEKRPSFPHNTPLVFYIAVAFLMLGIFVKEPNQAGSYAPWAGYWYVHTGEAYAFHQQYLERVEALKNGGDIVTFAPYVYRPWVLATTDLSEDPNNEANEAIASWYGKQAVICISQQD